jgi:putative ABC transport system ATP-binding protein
MITLSGVTKAFDGKRTVTALENVSLAIERGEMVSIVGASGSGKSTLLNLIGALDHPTSGWIEVDGHRLDGLNDDDLTKVRRDKVGFIFQFFNLLPTLSCLENVLLYLRRWAGSRSCARTAGSSARKHRAPTNCRASGSA